MAPAAGRQAGESETETEKDIEADISGTFNESIRRCRYKCNAQGKNVKEYDWIFRGIYKVLEHIRIDFM